MTATTPVEPMRRMRLGELDLSVIDPFDRDSQYIYDEIFVGRTYAHPKIVLPERAAIIDVGANIGLCSLWMAQTHHPRTILAYEASPTTHRYLADNVARYVDAKTTRRTASIWRSRTRPTRRSSCISRLGRRAAARSSMAPSCPGSTSCATSAS